MNNIDEMIKVLQHFKDGGEVECKAPYCEDGSEVWSFIKNPIWNFSTSKYRIKRKPKEFIIYPDSSSPENYNICICTSTCEGAIRVREVLDEHNYL